MSRVKRVLIQFDPDPQASLFDAVVAIDCSVDQLLQYGHVDAADVRDLVHGAMFTRAPKQLHNTAIFVGGADVQRGEALLKQVCDTFFGPMRVSVMLDSHGANTTSAAAVLAAAEHLPLHDTTATLLAGTGPVGQRVARLLAHEGASVRVCSRKLDRAENSIEQIEATLPAPPKGQITAWETCTHQQLAEVICDAELIIAAGAAGIELLPAAVGLHAKKLKVAIDLNAVAPLGIEMIETTDQATGRDGVICYGAVGVGGLKMSIHRAAIEKLFSANDLVLDAEEIFALGRDIQERKTS